MGTLAVGVLAGCEDALAPVDFSGALTVVAGGCTPGQTLCTGPTTYATCWTDGERIAAERDCVSGRVCEESQTGSQCVEPLCEMGQMVCTDLHTRRQCDASGLDFTGPEEPCADEFVCLSGSCYYSPCVPKVLVLVDRSGSMSDDWFPVGATVEGLVEEHVHVAFGFAGFPDDLSDPCGVPPAPTLPLGLYTAPEVRTWFASQAPLGPTPLANMLATIANDPERWFEGEAGSLVLLSDGLDTCTPEGLDATELAVQATNLLRVRDIKTYVIGYKFFDAPAAPLDAIAAAGGTGLDGHLVANDLTELEEAFDRIVRDFKLCGPGGGR